MSDLRVITILPSQPVSGIQQPQMQAGQSLLAGLSGLQPGSVLSGFIINRDMNGNPVLRTDSGDITFASNFFLKIGSEITIRIEHIAGNNSAHIISVNGSPPEIAVTQSAFSQEPEVIVSENLRPATTAPTPQNNANNAINSSPAATIQPSATLPVPTITVTGTIISPAPASGSEAGGAVNSAVPLLPVGSQLSLKIINLALPQSLPATVDERAINNTATASTGVSATSAAANPETDSGAAGSVTGNIGNAGNTAAPSPTPPAAKPYSAYINTMAAPPAPATPQGAPLPAPPAGSPVATPAPATHSAANPQTEPAPMFSSNTAPKAGQNINASVISNNLGGEAIIRTPVGIMLLQNGTNLPVGSQVVFEIGKIETPETLEMAGNQAAAPGLLAGPAPLTHLARNPGALADIFSLLSGLPSSDAQNFITKNIPYIGQPQGAGNAPSQSLPAQNLLSSLLALSSALRSGDFRQWLGYGNAKWLEDNNHGNLLKKAEGEFLAIARQFTEVPAGQWQSLFFPIAVAGELQQTRLFVKRDRKQKENEGRALNEEDTRFVLEMDLSQLGEIQMDGFVKRNNADIQFDLVIRSHIPLAKDIEREIARIYTDTSELTGYKGSITFQPVKDFPVNPMEDIVSSRNEFVVA